MSVTTRFETRLRVTALTLILSFANCLFPSVLWYCWLGLLTCNSLPDNLYCVGGDVKPCSINVFSTVNWNWRRCNEFRVQTAQQNRLLKYKARQDSFMARTGFYQEPMKLCSRTFFILNNMCFIHCCRTERNQAITSAQENMTVH